MDLWSVFTEGKANQLWKLTAGPLGQGMLIEVGYCCCRCRRCRCHCCCMPPRACPQLQHPLRSYICAERWAGFM